MTFDEGQIRRLVLTELARGGSRYVPVGISVKHVHLSRKDLDSLFGEGYELHPLRAIVQPGQYAAKEQVTLIGPKGKLEKVRVIGPVRKETQVELAITDAMGLGMKNVPIRMSGDTKSTPGIGIVGPKGEINISQGVIIAARHLHLSDEQAQAFGVHNGQVVHLRVEGERPCVLENVVCRTGFGHELEFHVDTDEANACRLKNNDYLQVIIPGEEKNKTEEDPQKEEELLKRTVGKVISALLGISGNDSPKGETKKDEEPSVPAAPEEILDLVTERDINDAVQEGKKTVYCDQKALITPSASDRAAECQIMIQRVAEKKEKKTTVKPEEGTEVLDLVTERNLNDAFRDDKEIIYCTKNALITASAQDRSAETGIRIVRVEEEATCK